jgi:RNA polymerase sigma factor (sigma-70 family)
MDAPAIRPGSEVSVDEDSARSRAEEALRVVYESDFDRLVSVSRVLVRNVEDASEIVQESFIRSLIAWERSGVPDEPGAYVRRVVLNRSKNHIRGEVRRRMRRPLSIRNEPRGPELAAVAAESSAEVLRALRSLSTRQRQCVTLRHVAGCSVTETAGLLGVSTGSVKTHTARGLATLASRLEGES